MCMLISSCSLVCEAQQCACPYTGHNYYTQHEHYVNLWHYAVSYATFKQPLTSFPPGCHESYNMQHCCDNLAHYLLHGWYNLMKLATGHDQFEFSLPGLKFLLPIIKLLSLETGQHSVVNAYRWSASLLWQVREYAPHCWSSLWLACQVFVTDHSTALSLQTTSRWMIPSI